MIAIRVHQPTYDKIKEAAAIEHLSISEEDERRLLRSIDWDENFEGALRQKGYLPMPLDQGRIWVPPEMPSPFILRISVDAAAIANEMGCPGLQPLIDQALKNLGEKRGLRP